MKAFLMYRDRDFDLKKPLPPNGDDLIQDLELSTLFHAMALDDEFLYSVAQSAVLSSLTEPGDILYRQQIFQDCLSNEEIVRDMYALAVETIESERKNFWSILRDYPDAILSRSVDVLHMFVEMLKRLKRVADDKAKLFKSEGFTTLFSMLRRELNDDYFATINYHLRELKFRDGVLISAELEQGNKGANYILRKPHDRQGWFARMFGTKPPTYGFYISDRDESGAKALSTLRDRGVNLAANALAQSNDHILSFFTMLRTELAFYIGCLNAHAYLARLGAPTCLPLPAPVEERRHAFRGLYDVCLALTKDQKVVGNDGEADRKNLFIITGANQGGKTTFLRSIGIAQLMTQCGMFAPAEFFCVNVCNGLFTHFKREEDASMRSGKFDEELRRMNEIANQITSNSILLFNESFAATNEREGSEIARQIVCALLEKRIKVFFVTHLYEFAGGFYEKRMDDAIFLRAERQDDGSRTFKIIEGRPLQTSYGEDLYQKIFLSEEIEQQRREN
ncbi:DNA mismatch repair protein MutS domain protein [Candidatus Moduliflexus flocculans]|uniref:DNA mismatch repair protein MutS domain protein n=1 Tax=Candidatus Moduliflexus flocculans TaxID=1499966 RepID=A0A081BS07_9BACT|nr:DNA mismatch repair protein MutS domain protein [Candidatus Moduliflexus flocculans]